MAKIREIKGRLKAVANIQRITNTMQMIATSKFQQAVKRASSSKPYAETIFKLVSELGSIAVEGGDFDHYLLRKPEKRAGKRLLLVITSNRGLCGGYNSGILRMAKAYLNDAEDEVELDVIGKKGTMYFRFIGQAISNDHRDVDDPATVEQVIEMAGDYISRFGTGEYDALDVIYTKFVSNSVQKATVTRLLPLAGVGGGVGEKSDGVALPMYDFSPSAKELLAELLPLAAKSQLLQMVNDAVVSEQIGRMVAMKGATESAEKMGKALSRKFNRARQSQITNDLIEVVSGSVAAG